MPLPPEGHIPPHSSATDHGLRSLGLTPMGGMSTASHRLRALSALSGPLTDSLSPEDAARLVEQQALSALGATSAVVMTLGDFPAHANPSAVPSARATPGALRVVHAIGLRPSVRAALEQLSLDAPVPLAEVARFGDPIFLSSEPDLHRYPQWGAAMVDAGTRAAAIVPVWANGELRGVLGLTWASPRTFDDDERAFVLTLGVMCAQAIMRAHLRFAEREARAAAEKANRSKTAFLTMISHELRTPMHAVMGYTELLAEEVSGPVTEVQKRHLGRMRASGKHLLELVEELLAYARLEAGEVIVAPELVQLLDVVEQSLDLVRPMAAKKGLTLQVAGANEPVSLYTDGRKLRQILANLLANAVKFTETGTIVVAVRHEQHHGVTRAYCSVSDSGRGIAVDDLELVFDPFWQRNPDVTEPSGGTGLGLSVARQLARLLGGDVTIANSTVDGGSSFVLSLPLRYRASGRLDAIVDELAPAIT